MVHATVERKFKIEITYNGLTEPFHIDSDDLIGALRQHAVERFKITQQPHTFSLYRADGSELDPSFDNKTVEQVGITPGELLVLRPGIVRGGETYVFSTSAYRRANDPQPS